MSILETLLDDTQDRQLVSVRVVNVSREHVFRAWTQPQYMAQWWGPGGFTNTFEKFEPVEGGTWKFIMHGPNGGNYPNESRFVEVSQTRIIIQHVSPPHFHLVASFEEINGSKTRITFRQVFETVSECEKVKMFAVEANEQNLDRLEMVLKATTAEKKLLFTGNYKVKPAEVFSAWVTEEILKAWWGPHGFTNPVCKIDPRAGGSLLIHMQSPDGMVFPTHGYYHLVKQPLLLVFTTSAFADDRGVDQLENLNTVELKETGSGTELSLLIEVIRSNATADKEIDAMEEGWRQSLDKLARILESR
jgi:uncharacterized protein YndB with AHSA1/START domain